MESFAQRLTFLRENKGLKKKELADILNVSAPCITQYENGSSMPGFDILWRISQLFSVSIDYLIGNDDSAFRLDNLFAESTTYLDLLEACSRVPDNNRCALLAVIHALQETTDN